MDSMARYSSEDLDSLNPSVQVAFIRYLSENPNNRRVSLVDLKEIIGWLTDPHKKPLSQKDFSRRNYVRKTFRWDSEKQLLIAMGKNEQSEQRQVVTEDRIFEVINSVHVELRHAGWDATWDSLSSSYYGILRSDMIFLLKRCQCSTLDASKRPKGSSSTENSILTGGN